MRLPAQYHDGLRRAVARARKRQERQTEFRYLRRLAEGAEALLRTQERLVKEGVKLAAETKRANEWRAKARTLKAELRTIYRDVREGVIVPATEPKVVRVHDDGLVSGEHGGPLFKATNRVVLGPHKPTADERLVKRANRLHESGKPWELVAFELGFTNRRKLYELRRAVSGNGKAR